MTGQRRFLINC